MHKIIKKILIFIGVCVMTVGANFIGFFASDNIQELVAPMCSENVILNNIGLVSGFAIGLYIVTLMLIIARQELKIDQQERTIQFIIDKIRCRQ